MTGGVLEELVEEELEEPGEAMEGPETRALLSLVEGFLSVARNQLISRCAFLSFPFVLYFLSSFRCY